MALRVGVDTGGTFTDLLALDDLTGVVQIRKTLSTPDEPAEGVAQVLREARDVLGADIASAETLVQGNTIAINALVQRRGAVVGLFVTKGFRDVLEIGRLRLPRVSDLYVQRLSPLVPRRLVAEVDERLDAEGVELVAPDRDDVVEEASRLVEQGVDALAIAFMHSHRNNIHEERVASWVRREFPGLFVTTSSELWPTIGEYERTMVAVVNAFVGKRMARYVGELSDRAAELDCSAPLLSTKSNGGVMDVASAKSRPVETLLSGPASGVVAAHHAMVQKGLAAAISFDMGGTTADVALLSQTIPYAYETFAGDAPIVMPSVDVQSIGAGGGSIVWRDEVGVLKVGPHSAGAFPGPACYDRGGEEPTVTDAYVALGMIPEGLVLGGQVTVRKDLAVNALMRVGVDDPRSVLDIATSNMAARLIPLAAAHGLDLSDMPIIAFGGAGPTHACLLARELGLKIVVVPPIAGAMCALGAILADLRVDFVRTVNVPCDPSGIATIQASSTELAELAHAWLSEQSVRPDSVSLRTVLDMRFRGQSFEIDVPITEQHLRDGWSAVQSEFLASYSAIYGRADTSRPSEIVNVRLQLIGHVEKPPPIVVASAQARPSLTANGIPVASREDIAADDVIAGPRVITQYDATTYVPADASAVVDRFGNLEIELV